MDQGKDESVENQTPDAEHPVEQEMNPEQVSEAGGEEAVEAPAVEAELEALKAQLEDANEQLAAQKDLVIRAQAEAQNVRRRAEQDVEKAHKFALEKMVQEVLPVVDSLERAMEVQGEGESFAKALREGIDLTLGLFTKALQKFHIEQVDPAGEPFDPQLHQAMSLVEQDEVEPNTVVAVMQKGYTLNGRLVRPAMVMVSKASEKDAPKIDEQA